MAAFADKLSATLTAAIEYLRNEPWIAVGAVLLMAVLYFLLQRKSRLEREADRRLRQLRQEKAGHYDHLRPPQ